MGKVKRRATAALAASKSAAPVPVGGLDAVDWSLPAAARRLWLEATDAAGLAEAEELLRLFLRQAKGAAAAGLDLDAPLAPAEAEAAAAAGGACGPVLRRCAVDDAAAKTLLLLAQRGASRRDVAGGPGAGEAEAADGELGRRLRSMGFVARLARDVLRYPLPRPLELLGQNSLRGQAPPAAHPRPPAAKPPPAAPAGVPSIFTTGYAAMTSAPTPTPTAVGGPPDAAPGNAPAAPMRIEDDALPSWAFRALRNALAPPAAAYWAAHEYSVEPPSPYFSYVLPLPPPAAVLREMQAAALGGSGGRKRGRGTEAAGGCDADQGAAALAAAQRLLVRRFGAVGALAAGVWAAGVRGGLVAPVLQEADPAGLGAAGPSTGGTTPLLRPGRFAELWAHCRPHACGHQLHYDADDEGRGGVRNPVCGSICYLSGSADANSAGGPTLMTDQEHVPPGEIARAEGGDPTARRPQLATRGWLVWPRRNRVVVFDGTFLHGVVPGRGPPRRAAATDEALDGPVFSESADDAAAVAASVARRVTVMCAIWNRIAVRRGEPGSWGSARPFPGAFAGPEGDDDPAAWEAAGATTGAAAAEWAAALATPAPRGAVPPPPPVARAPFAIDAVWETPEGAPWPAGAPMPHYETAFQGF